MSKTKMLAAQELIREKRYDEARSILRSVDHPKAIEWLEKLDKIDPPNALQKIFRAVLPKSQTPISTKNTTRAVHPLEMKSPQITAKETKPVQPVSAPVAELEEETTDEESDNEVRITPNHEKHSHYPKAVAGEFDGIHFKSQLEIRFAAELKKRDVTYEYEPARIGKGSYLIDFHLPDHGIWVEVKGKMDARDEFMLQECAQDLISDQLYIYMSDRKMHFVHGDSLEYIWPGKFWDMLEEKQSQKG